MNKPGNPRRDQIRGSVRASVSIDEDGPLYKHTYAIVRGPVWVQVGVVALYIQVQLNESTT